MARDSAKLAGEFYRTVGAKLGMTPEQFADTFALNVTGAQMDAEGGVRFEQGGQVPEARGADGGAALPQENQAVQGGLGEASVVGARDVASAPASNRVAGTEAMGDTTQTDEARQFADTERAYGGREAFDKAKAEGRTKLNYRQWVQVRTPAFKAWFGDWEGSLILNGEPLTKLKSDDAPMGGFKDVAKWAGDVFASQGGKAVRVGFGEIVLDQRAAQDSLAHGGANKYKKVAFAAVKDVIERGALVWQGSDGREDSFYFSAPVDIDGITNIETVLVHRDFNTQRMYLHSVTTKENLLNQRVSSVDAEASERSGSIDSRGIAKILQDAIGGKGVSKVIDPDTGEPLVVYHGTNADFSEFRAGDGMFGRGIYLAQLPEYAPGFADEGGVNVLPVFAKIIGKDDGAILPNKRGGVFIAFNAEQIKSSTGNTGAFDPTNPNILMQGAEDARGFIRFDQAGITNAPSLIALLEKADNSTFLHELGHYFFEVYNHLAAQPDAPAEVKAAMSALVAFAGVESVEAWQAMTPEARREGHEKVADAFEQYLFEGKAPSLGLHGVGLGVR